jgi:predicted permease
MLSLLRRLGWYLRRRTFDAELAEEMDFHRSLSEANGADAGEAARRLGNRAQIAEASRAAWSFAPIEELAQDVRYSLRVLRARPGFALASTLTLALGVGATAALASVLDAVLLRPLPYRESERVVQLLEVNIPRNRTQTILSPANALAWRDRVRALDDVGLYTWSNLTLTDDHAEQISGRSITTNLFALLGAAPAHGRGFVSDDTLPGAPRALMLSHGLWRRRFGSDPSVIGRPLALRGGPALVVGVMPADFRSLGGEEFWEPWPMTAEVRVPRGRYAMAIGRMAEGATVERVDAELRDAARIGATDHPRFNAGWTARAMPLAQQVAGGARPVLLLLAGAIGFVLLVACANVANLNLGQALARRNELAIRSALGASRARVVRQWLVEGVLIAALGGALGVVVSAVAVKLLVASGIELIPRLEEVALNWRVLGLAMGITAGAGILFGIAPALTLKEGGQREVIAGFRSAGGGARAGRLRGALVTAQVALSIVLLTGAGLAMRSLAAVLGEDPGFDAKGVAFLAVDLPGNDYPDAESRQAFITGLLDRARALPGVQRTGFVNFLPPREVNPATSFSIVGDPPDEPGQSKVTQVVSADAGYFQTMGIGLRRGRLFGGEDRAGGRRVAVVNQALATQLGAEPLGRSLKVAWGEPDSTVEVIGVVADVRTDGLDAPARPAVYFPLTQEPSGYLHLLVRTAGDPEALLPPLRAAVRALDPALPVLGDGTMEVRLSESLDARRYPMMLLIVLGVLSLVLAAVGLYGVLAYVVSQREGELGVRRALGATPRAVASLVLGQTARLVALGTVIGLAGALLTTRYLGTLLYGITPTDPVTLGAVVLLLAAVAGLAALGPSIRAARVEPLTAMRTSL